MAEPTTAAGAPGLLGFRGNTTGERREALEVSRRMRAAGASHLILSVPAGAGPASLRQMADEVARPLLDR